MAMTNELWATLSQLKENWDGYGAAAPMQSTVELAHEFANLLDAMRRKSAQPCPLQISPTRIGGVLLEWEDCAMEHEVEINPDGSVGFLHSNKSTGQITTRKISPGSMQREFLQELQLLAAA